MTARPPQVTIIIVNYNTPRLVRELIHSLTTSTAGFHYEMIVVDNNSRPEGRYFPEISTAERVLHLNHNLGFGRAANLAGARSSAPYLLFANSDCRAAPGVVTAMFEYLESHPDVAACSPRVVSPDGAVNSTIRRFPDHHNILGSRGSLWPFARREYTLVADESRKMVDSMSATFMMVRRELFEQVGGFDESYFMYVEDTDLCRRLTDLGKSLVYLGNLTVVHQWGASTRARRLTMKFEHHQSIKRYFARHHAKRPLANLILTCELAVNLIITSLNAVVLRREPRK